jgi:hypothetical protein
MMNTSLEAINNSKAAGHFSDDDNNVSLGEQDCGVAVPPSR